MSSQPITFEKRPAGDMYVIRLNGELIGQIIKFRGEFVVEFDHYDRQECAQNTAKNINAAKQLVRDYATAMECIGGMIRKAHAKMEAAAHPAIAIAKAVGCEIVSFDATHCEVKIGGKVATINYRPYGYFVSIYGGKYGFDLLEEKRITSNSELKSELLYLSVDAESEAENIAAHYAAAAQADEAAAQDEAAVMAHYEASEAPVCNTVRTPLATYTVTPARCRYGLKVQKVSAGGIFLGVVYEHKRHNEFVPVLPDGEEAAWCNSLHAACDALLSNTVTPNPESFENIDMEFVVLIDGTALAPNAVAKLAHKEGFNHIADYIQHIAQNYPVGAAVSVPIQGENWLLFLAEKTQTAKLIQLEFTQSADCFAEHK